MADFLGLGSLFGGLLGGGGGLGGLGGLGSAIGGIGNLIGGLFGGGGSSPLGGLGGLFGGGTGLGDTFTGLSLGAMGAQPQDVPGQIGGATTTGGQADNFQGGNFPNTLSSMMPTTAPISPTGTTAGTGGGWGFQPTPGGGGTTPPFLSMMGGTTTPGPFSAMSTANPSGTAPNIGGGEAGPVQSGGMPGAGGAIGEPGAVGAQGGGGQGGQALSGGGGLGSLFGGNQSSGLAGLMRQMFNNPVGGTALNQFQAGAAGQLTPGLQQYVDQARHSGIQGVRSNYARMGLSGSTMEQQDINAVNRQADAMGGQLALQEEQMGLQGLGTNANMFSNLAKLNMQQNQDATSAYNNWLRARSAEAAMGGTTGTGTGTDTGTNAWGFQPTTTDQSTTTGTTTTADTPSITQVGTSDQPQPDINLGGGVF